MTVSEFIPSGFLSTQEALNRLGRELFRLEWTGEEHKARQGLISADEWLRIKDLPPARGGGAPGSGAMRPAYVPPAKPQPHSTGNPSDPSYQEEYRASERYVAARHRLRQLLESGERHAAILDPFTGSLHRASGSLWRRHDADRMIERGQAPIPHSPNTGRLLIKQFAVANESARPLPEAKIQEAIEVLTKKIAI